MQLKERIIDAIHRMSLNELSILYEQIKILENMKTVSLKKNVSTYTLDKVHEMTSSSKTNWSDTVIQEREERI
jgi:hypothetical protein